MKRRDSRRFLYLTVIFCVIVTVGIHISFFHSLLVNAKGENTTKSSTSSTHLTEGENVRMSVKGQEKTGRQEEADKQKEAGRQVEAGKQKEVGKQKETGKQDSGIMSESKVLRIVLDPGHGGLQSGAARDNEQVEEKTLNLKIAKYLKKELETYDKVKVYLTRSGDSDVELVDRTKFAVDKKADVMISLHNNAAGPCAAYDHGCTVLAAKAGYKDALALEGQKLSCNILNELSKVGIENQGILLRDSEAKERYPNGILADYYAIIRGGVENDMLTVLIEHAFVDSDSDYKAYLSTDKKLKKLALADATGIARYYQLVKKVKKSDIGSRVDKHMDNKEQQGEKCVLEPLASYKEKIVHAVDGDAKHNKVSYRIYYDEGDTKQKNISAEDIEAFQRIRALADTHSVLDVKRLKEFYSIQKAGSSD